MGNARAVVPAHVSVMNAPTMKCVRRAARSGDTSSSLRLDWVLKSPALRSQSYITDYVRSIAQVETLLKGQEPDTAHRISPPEQENAFTAPIQDEAMLPFPEISALGNEMETSMPSSSDAANPSQPVQTFFPPPPSMPNDTPWDLIGLGLEEPLPTQEVIDELYVSSTPFSFSGPRLMQC